jgi:hypothetical protein
MKIHTPVFILGLLVFITPIIGLPQIYEQIILAAYGIAIMILVSAVKVVKSTKDKKETFKETLTENSQEIEITNYEKEEIK